MADQFYIEEGYVEANYFGYIAEAEISLSGAFSPSFTVDIADTTGYFIPDYIETDYITAGVTEAQASLSSAASITANGGKLQDADATKSAQFTVSVDVGVIREGNASFTSAFTPTLTANVTRTVSASLDASISILMTASPIRQGEVTLSNIVNLSLQGARTRDTSAAFSSAFSQLAVVGSLQDATATLSTQFTQTNNAGLLQDITEAYSSAFTQSANAIEFISKWPNNKRPVTWNKRYLGSSTTSSNITFSSSIKKWDSYALQLKASSYGIASTEIKNNSFEIPASTDFAFETWIYFQGDNRVTTDSPFILHALDSEFSDFNNLGTGWLWAIGENNDKVEAKIRTFDGSIVTITSTQSWPSNSWVHIGLKRSSGTISLVYNGTTLGTSSYSGRILGEPTSSTYHLILQHQDQIGTPDDVFYDGLHYQLGTSSFTGTSSNPKGTGNEYTLVLTNFENNFDDDLGLAFGLDSETLSNAFSLTTTVGATVDATVLQVSAATLSVDPNYIADHSATLDSQASITTLPGFVKDFSANFSAFNTQVSIINKIGNTLVSIDSAFTMTADVNEIVQLSSNLSTQFTQSADINAIFADTANISSAFTLNADAKGLIGGDANISSSFTQTATAIRIQPGAASFTDAFTLSATGFIVVDGSATLSTQFTQSTDAQRYRETDIDFDSIATTINVINKIGQGLIGLDVNFNLQSDPVLIAGGGVLLEGIATQDVSVGKIVDPGAVFDAAFLQTANGRLSTDAASNMVASFALSINADITTEIETQFDAVNSLVVTNVDVFRGFEAEFDLAFTETVDGIRIRTDSASIASAFAQTVNAGKKVDAVIDLGALFTPSIDYRVLHIDQYVYTIPKETRSYSVPRESRSYTIQSENRTYTIQGD